MTPERIPSHARIFLFSLDLEDIRDFVPGGHRYQDRVPRTVETYLEFLDHHGMKATFFTVGLFARKYGPLLGEIAKRGHEIASHSSRHIPVTEMTPRSFRDDLEENVKVLEDCSGTRVSGFRAPIFSMNQDTRWAYEAMGEMGLRYSSSVLPAKNPLHGWPGFGREPRRVEGTWEIPISVASILVKTVPFAGGVYFRVLPDPWIRWMHRRSFGKGRPVVGYFHPYDIDVEQERFMHPTINESRFYNFLMYYNRKGVMKRLERVMKLGCRIIPYREFVDDVLEGQ
jgi:polysaccharide deacetylase family protein (PEP-CTERM system associated)